MRKALLTSTVVIGSLCLAMSAAHASAGPFVLKSSSVGMIDDNGAAREDARSALTVIFGRFVTLDAKITATSAADPETANGECPEKTDTKVADADGAGDDKDEKKTLAGPEPIYFAF